ncbi:TPA: hypothetical protein HA239_03120, partial [Candidatus Woesearchaeota archaeon]|nr:hypothetical protein [Candidatus Woesearchaeota archaeon]
DSMKKEGKVLYTNICHCHALKCLSDMFMMLEMKKKHLKYLSLYNRTKEKIEKVFWNGRYYTDWIHDERREHFSTDGNMLAVVWDIAPEKHSIPIAEYSKKHGIDKVPSACVYPLYPKKMTAPLLSMLGLSDYHNGLSWLWLGCASALAKEKAGLEKEAVEILNTIADMIVDYGIVYEIYDNKGKPVKRPLYKAEYPFAWSSGMFLYAVRKILKKPI